MMNFLQLFRKAHRRHTSEPGSGAFARDRVKSALMRDRTDATSEALDMLSADILKAVACYMEPAGAPALSLKQPSESECALLLARVPIKSLRRTSKSAAT